MFSQSDLPSALHWYISREPKHIYSFKTSHVNMFYSSIIHILFINIARPGSSLRLFQPVSNSGEFPRAELRYGFSWWSQKNKLIGLIGTVKSLRQPHIRPPSHLLPGTLLTSNNGGRAVGAFILRCQIERKLLHLSALHDELEISLCYTHPLSWTS